MEEKVYKPIIKSFMGIADVRVIDVGSNEYVVCKDIFNALGLVEDGHIWSKPKEKALRFLEIIDKRSEWKSFPLRFRDKHSPKGQVRNVECLNIETVPIVLTRFEPTARRGKEAMDKWSSFMKFVNDLLQYYELHKYVIADKDKQKQAMDEIISLGGKPVIANVMVNKIMGELILQEEPKFAIKKEELKVYQPKISIDLLEVRDFVMEKFKNGFEVYDDNKKAYEHALKMARKKYGEML